MKKHTTCAALAILSFAACEQGPGPGPKGEDMAAGGDGPAVAALSFDTETADPAASGAAVALVVDSKNAPHLIYFSGGQEADCNKVGTTTKFRPAQLWHATRTGAGDFQRRMVSGNDAEANGVSAVLDPKTDRPVVSYQGGKQGIDFVRRQHSRNALP